MKRKIYLFLCILACTALFAACSKKDTTSGGEVQLAGDGNTSAQIDTAEEGTTEENKSNQVPQNGESMNSSEEENTEDEALSTDADTDNNQSEVPVTDGGEVEDDGPDSSTTDAQNNVSQNPTEEFSASGTFNGFVDSSSVEITMSDGTYQTFFVYDEDVIAQLQRLEDGGDSPVIHFTYRGIEGQVNPEIISIQ